ncbi:MAG: hypothetical protein IJT02_03010 [Synergistaceae bacterium]|nr:hypothetical protein [Synergistaceae bacterium]
MSRPNFSVKHVETQSQLPAKLTKGRAYFVDDEQIIIVDHGYGPVTYGGKVGAQGIPGEPLPVIQAQIDSLSEASLKMQNYMWEESEYVRTHDERLEGLVDDARTELQAQVDQTANAILTLTALLHEKFNQYDNAVSTLAKTIGEMYPDPQEQSYDDPLDNETLSTEAGTWTIQQTNLKDGTIVLELEAQELLINTLTTGDRVEYDGTDWKVADKQETDGFITLTLTNL